MNFLMKAPATHAPVATPSKQRPKEFYRAHPCGEIDYEALTKDVKRRFPKILAYLAR